MKKYLVLLLFSYANVQGQDFTWWAKLVKWDGVTSWHRYINTNPAFLGPNALPVPFITNGSIDSLHSFTLTGNLHFSKGDYTQNFGLYVNYCLVKDIIAFDIYWVPYEHFQMSHAIKERRHVFSYFYYNNSAQGDLHLNTNIQLLNKIRNKVHLALRIGYRLPTSNGLGAARFTDAPGYYFDLSAGKPLHDHSAWKLIAMAGLYFWQTNLAGYMQNDAFLFGAGMEWNPSSWRMQVYGSGYLGYMNGAGDKPILLRGRIERIGKKISTILKFQQGLHDFKYASIETGLRYTLKTNKLNRVSPSSL